MITSPHPEAPDSGISYFLPFIRLALVMAWIANVVLVSAVWLNAYDGGRAAKLLGPTALLSWIILVGWLGWRSQFQQRAR
jgi:hypothetical protein